MPRRQSKNLKIDIKAPTPPLGIELGRCGSTTVMYVRVSDGKIVITKELEEDVLADYDANGRLVGFEVVGLRPGKSGNILGRIQAKFGAEVPALNLLNELMPA